MAARNIYEIIYTKRFKKQVAKAPHAIRKAVDEALAEIQLEPFRNPNVKQLKGALEGFHRYRIGGYRLIYKIEKEKLIIIAIDFGPRGDTYK